MAETESQPDTIDFELPFWSDGKLSGSHHDFLEVRAQLCTRDGRRFGNAVVVGTREAYGVPVADVLTDMGNTMTLNLKELRSGFYPPQWRVSPEWVGKRRNAEISS